MNHWRTIGRMSSAQIRDLQNKKLHRFLNTQVYPFSVHYRTLFDQHKINPKKIRTVDDLRHLPLTSKHDFQDGTPNSQKHLEYILRPDRDKIRRFWPKRRLARLAATAIFRGKEFAEEDLEQEYRPVFMTFTTGTTSSPVPFLYSNYDIQNLRISGARMMNLFDVPHGERIVSLFPFAPHLAFWQVFFGGLAAEVFALSTGGGKVFGTEGNITAIQRVKPYLLLGVPSYVYHVLREAHQNGRDMSFIKRVVLGAARVTIPFKQRLADLLAGMGAKQVSIFGTYGFTEARTAWAECPTALDVSSGYHLYPDKEIFEVIDPKTGEVKGEGEDGELVYTALDARASAVVRYRTGDFVHGGIMRGPCPHCGLTVPRISSDITRISDIKDLQLSKIKGALVNLSHFSQILNNFSEIEEWQLVLCKKDNDPYEVDELILYLVVKDQVNRAKLEERINSSMISGTEVAPNEYRYVALDEMVKRLELETANKEKRILDLRPKA